MNFLNQNINFEGFFDSTLQLFESAGVHTLSFLCAFLCVGDVRVREVQSR